MKFVCDRCQTKYSIADERVRGKVLKVKCKSCANVITVREARRPSPAASPAVGPGLEFPDSERTILAPQPPMHVPSAAPPPFAKPATPAPPTARRPTAPLGSGAGIGSIAGGGGDDRAHWFMALDGQRTGPFTRRQLVDKIVLFPRDADLHVWNEELDGWKEPKDIPTIAADVLARRRPLPPPPPIGPPALPRRPTPAPASHDGHVPRRPTPHPSHASSQATPMAPGAGLGFKLPPSGAPRPSAPAMSAVGGAAVAHAVRPALSEPDPSTLLETPGPDALHLHGLGGTNGVAGRSDAPAPGGRATGRHATSSDVLSMLNLQGAPAAAPAAPAAPPVLLSTAALTTGWEPSVADIPGGRARTGRLIMALLGVIALVIGVVVFGTMKKSPPPPAVAAAPITPDPIGTLADKVAATPPASAPAAPASAPSAAPAPLERASGKPSPGKGRGAHPLRAASGSSSAPAQAAVDSNAARFRDTSRPNITVAGAASSSRPPPSQSDISRVINNNRAGIKNCYQRALLRDSTLTHGKIVVRVTIGISGRVKHVGVSGPQQFQAVEPCIREVVSRWAFPQAPDEYGTEFAYVFQGNE